MIQKIFVLVTILLAGQIQAQFPVELMTKPELSRYTETSSYADVMKFMEYVENTHDHIHIETMLTSIEGKDIPLAILANPPITSPEEGLKSEKLIVYIQGNIHGGEVEGKEAVMMMIRDILFGEKSYLLENQIILFAPIYNADGNDKMAEGNRRSQEGSPIMSGERRSGEDFDLNRDGMKMEAVETKGLIKNMVLRWDPDLFVDLHTTNGTWHGNALTYAPSYEHAGHPATSRYTMDVMLPEIQKTVLNKHDLHFGIYGGYSLRQGWPPKNLYTYNHHPRYLVNQFGLRNRMAILSETFAHDPFYKRIHSAYTFVSEILEYSNRHSHDIMSINAKAEKETIEKIEKQGGEFSNGVKYKMVPTKTPLRLRTYDHIPYINSEGDTIFSRTGNIIYVDDVANYNAFEATLESRVPRGYLIPAEFSEIVEKLKDHGIEVTELQSSNQFSGEQFVVDKLENSTRAFEGHFMSTLHGSFEETKKTFHNGDYLISMKQPLANLIFYLLEPQSDDGLAAWNFIDEYLKSNGILNQPVIYPIFKF